MASLSLSLTDLASKLAGSLAQCSLFWCVCVCVCVSVSIVNEIIDYCKTTYFSVLLILAILANGIKTLILIPANIYNQSRGRTR